MTDRQSGKDGADEYEGLSPEKGRARFDSIFQGAKLNMEAVNNALNAPAIVASSPRFMHLLRLLPLYEALVTGRPGTSDSHALSMRYSDPERVAQYDARVRIFNSYLDQIKATKDVEAIRALIHDINWIADKQS